LNAAKYTIDHDDEESESDSDSNSESDSDSSMGSESDEEDTRARKKQKKSTKGRKASTKSKPAPSQLASATASTRPAAAPADPPALIPPPLILPPPVNDKQNQAHNDGQEELANDDADFDDVEEDAPPAKDLVPPWHVSRKEREANIRWNNTMLENLKAEWAAALPDQLKAKPKQT
jgi:hypothetical protein